MARHLAKGHCFACFFAPDVFPCLWHAGSEYTARSRRAFAIRKSGPLPNKVCSTIHTKFNGLLFKHNRKTSADRQISALLAENKLLEKSFLRCNQLDTRPKPGQNSFARIRNFLEQAFLVCPKIWRMLTPMASTSLLIYVPEPALGLGTSIKRTSGRFLPLMVPF